MRAPLRLTASRVAPCRPASSVFAAVAPTRGESAGTTASITPILALAGGRPDQGQAGPRDEALQILRLAVEEQDVVGGQPPVRARHGAAEALADHGRHRHVAVAHRASSSATVAPTRGESPGSRASVV